MESTEIEIRLRDGARATVVVAVFLDECPQQGADRERRERDLAALLGGAACPGFERVLAGASFVSAHAASDRVVPAGEGP